MRISADPRDRAYNPNLFGARIFLDGAEIKHVIIVDEEEGFVLRLVIDSKGIAKLAPCGTEILTEEKRGTVRIELRK